MITFTQYLISNPPKQVYKLKPIPYHRPQAYKNPCNRYQRRYNAAIKRKRGDDYTILWEVMQTREYEFYYAKKMLEESYDRYLKDRMRSYEREIIIPIMTLRIRNINLLVSKIHNI